ncbi:uncharacterized protein LOC116211483 [Punica granatum]|uniref:Uncharacterized protein LOC116211483 n=1 Tax=Punica granatum TaxID=22663 RepID=A0A6P8E5F2_PUNGR|nr:uncharacterized protein LOC116211483 [Punica granatum]
MSSSTAFPPPSLFLTSGGVRRRGVPVFLRRQYSLLSTLRFSRPGLLRAYASLAGQGPELSWGSADSNSEFNGWAVVEYPVVQKRGKKGLPKFVVGGIGASVAVLLAAIAQLSLSRQGFKFRLCSPLNALQGLLHKTERQANITKDTIPVSSESNTIEFEESSLTERVPDEIGDAVASGTSKKDVKLQRIIIPAAVDSTQQEALGLLRSLKIIEEGVRADELCTRREYARWLVRINSSLERNPRQRIVPTISLSGSTTAAFDDVSVEDPDFSSIQALAEAGVIPSKLLVKHTNHGSESQGKFLFLPERFISRQDLINWRVQLEYDFVPGLEEQISSSKVGFRDMKEVGSEISPEFLMDLLAGGKSIIRKVFGQMKRFQPSKPSTKGQAAVALTSGRMMEAIQAELSRVEAENSSRLIEMEEIRSELLGRGDIERVWNEKMKEEAARGLEVEKDYIAAIGDLEEEKILQKKTFEDHVKERAALECQRQLLLSLKEEVDEMSDRLSSERTIYVAEQLSVQEMITELQKKQEGLLDTKSILEAEKEAIRILRSWVEDEAKKNQARAKVLEEVGRRWRWDDQS